MQIRKRKVQKVYFANEIHKEDMYMQKCKEYEKLKAELKGVTATRINR